MARPRLWPIAFVAWVAACAGDAGEPDSTGFVFVSAAHWLGKDRILVADARQRRLQLHDVCGPHLRTMGDDLLLSVCDSLDVQTVQVWRVAR